ncbi:hypothetical protein FVEN_g2622 [Fusarium venenatum]|uniref:N-acetyltransferase domain-containing protein n=1 Tax=Fusarium venenatum TaxID=56646 RepID=A0A2L2T063_9HYPO|nr:uncharacterized protein FVRRES_05149 [Fusarium venenatum]KAG8359968.1 hypothetical protein FVEN_g2622 [Fusarium venenatum]KAH6992267.1 hypothetical protein EDB82DRAFT_495816 [Fusarium venenatum]CEI60713.1 unnamed protein product [Fusarium venenatum]
MDLQKELSTDSGAGTLIRRGDNVRKVSSLSEIEDAFASIKKDHPSLAWTVSEEDENLTWFSEKADGSFNRNGNVLFYYGCDLLSEALIPVFEDFKAW